jgi:hypothetical protein
MKQAIASVFVLLLSAGLRATVLVPASLDDLAREAGAIVRGRVVAVDARITEDRRAIDTIVTLSAEASLKGSLGPNVQFVVPGGTVGRYRRVFVGAPEFAVGQRAIVFLGWSGPSFPYLIGFGQCVFRITDDDRGASLVTPPMLVPPASGAAAAVRGDVGRRPVPLADFELRVRAMVQGK